MMTVYSREYYQAGLAEGKIKAKKLDKYRLGPDFILAYDLGPAASYPVSYTHLTLPTKA